MFPFASRGVVQNFGIAAPAGGSGWSFGKDFYFWMYAGATTAFRIPPAQIKNTAFDVPFFGDGHQRNLENVPIRHQGQRGQKKRLFSILY